MKYAYALVGALGVAPISLVFSCSGDEKHGGGASGAQDGSAEQDASAGNGGAGGSTRTGGSGGVSQRGDSASGTGGSSTGGMSQTGGSGGAMVSPSTIARAGIVIGSCLPDDGPNRDIAHIYNQSLSRIFYYQFGSQAECLATAGGGCDAAATCLGMDLSLGTPDVCAPSCDGSVFNGCGDGLQVSLDCARIGMQCDESSLCRWGDATPCDEATFVPTCTLDGRPEFCQAGVVQQGVDCDALGLVCDNGACHGTGADCVSDSSGSRVAFEGLGCSGDMLEACVGGRRAVRDCGDVAPGMTCRSFEGAYFCGYASECLPGEVDAGTNGTEETCEGTTLVYCNAGRIERVDCTSLGFTGCGQEAANSPSCIPSGILP